MIIYNVSMVLLNAYIVYEVRRKGICLRSFTTGVMSVLKAAGVVFFLFCFFLFFYLVYDVWMGHHLHMEMRPY